MPALVNLVLSAFYSNCQIIQFIKKWGMQEYSETEDFLGKRVFSLGFGI